MPGTHPRLLAPALLCALLSLPLIPNSGGAQEPTVSGDRRALTVIGIGRATASPDLALVWLAVETEAAEADDAVRDNARRTQQVIAAVRSGLQETDRVTTTGYSLQPRYHHPPRPERDTPPQIVGYLARNQVQVELRTLEDVGRIIDAATAAGANRVDNLQFQLQQRGPALQAALTAAAAEARAQAQAIAAALGLSLGPILEANASPTHGVVPQPRALRAEAMVAAAPTPIEPGEVTVNAVLQVTYAID